MSAKTNEIIEQKFTSLLQFFEEKDLINLRITSNLLNRDSLIRLDKIVNFEKFVHPLIEKFSSDEDSDDDNLNFHSPTIKDVMENLWDDKLIIKCSNLSEIKKKARPGLIFSKLDYWMTCYDLKQFILDIPLFKKDNFFPDIEEIKMLNEDDLKRGFVVFHNHDHAHKVFTFFNNPLKKKSVPSKNTNGELIEVSWGYDKSDLKDSNWYAVILRNVPPACNIDVIMTQCSHRGEKVLYVVPPIHIKHQYCCIVVVESMNDSEKICYALNNKEISKNKILKANIHPKSCKWRPNNIENSNLVQYFKNGFSKIKAESLKNEKFHFILKEIRDKNIEKYHKNKLNLQQIIERKYNIKDNNNVNTHFIQRENENILSKMKDSLILINKTSNITSTQLHTPDTDRNNDNSIKLNEINSSSLINQVSATNNNNIPNQFNLAQRPGIPFNNQINYNNMQYIKANQVNIINSLRPQMNMYPIPVYPYHMQTKIIPQSMITNPQIIPSLTPCYLSPIINPNSNLLNCNLIPSTSSINPVLMNNQIRYTTISPITHPGLFHQPIIMSKSIPVNPFIIKNTFNQIQPIAQNTANTNISNTLNNFTQYDQSKEQKFPEMKEIKKENTQKVNKEKYFTKSIEENFVQTERNYVVSDQFMIKQPKIENLPPLPKQKDEVKNIGIEKDYLLVKNTSSNHIEYDIPATKDTKQTHMSIDIIINNSHNEVKSSILDVKNIPVSARIFTSSSSSSSSSSKSEEDNSSYNSSSDSELIKKKRRRLSSKSNSKSKTEIYKGKFEKRRNVREYLNKGS